MDDRGYVLRDRRSERKRRRSRRAHRVEDEREPEKLSSITVLELYEGVQRSGRPDEEKTDVLAVLDSKTVVPADGEVMRRAGQLSGELYADGRPIDREDCIIAATALRENEPVLTGTQITSGGFRS